MEQKLTRKQEEVLTFIKKYIVKYGFPPSVREICAGSVPCNPRDRPGCKSEICVPVLRRRQSIFSEKQRPGTGEPLQAHHEAGAPVQKELLRDS